jgi:hypothetical protein
VTADAKRKIHLILLAAIVVATARTGYILYERHAENVEQARKQPPPLNPDYYVTPKKLYPYDLKSARQLTKQPVWVKQGYYYTYFPYDGSRHRADLAQDAGQLPPLDKLQILNVVTNATPGSPEQRQVMALFQKEGKTYAFPIGVEKDGDYKFYSDDMLFIQDPHELYKHWSPQIWQAIDQHQAKLGMNALQVSFAIGYGVPENPSDPSVVDYPNGGKPLRVVYESGKAAEIQPGK